MKSLEKLGTFVISLVVRLSKLSVKCTASYCRAGGEVYSLGTRHSGGDRVRGKREPIHGTEFWPMDRSVALREPVSPIPVGTQGECPCIA